MRLRGLENRMFDLKWHVWVASQQGVELQWLIFIDGLTSLNPHRNKYSGVSVEVVFMKVFLERKIYVECGQKYYMGWILKSIRKKKQAEHQPSSLSASRFWTQPVQLLYAPPICLPLMMEDTFSLWGMTSLSFLNLLLKNGLS